MDRTYVDHRANPYGTVMYGTEENRKMGIWEGAPVPCNNGWPTAIRVKWENGEYIVYYPDPELQGSSKPYNALGAANSSEALELFNQWRKQ